MLDKTKITHYL